MEGAHTPPRLSASQGALLPVPWGVPPARQPGQVSVSWPLFLRAPWLSAPRAHFADRPPACVSADRERPLVPPWGGGARGEDWTGAPAAPTLSGMRTHQGSQRKVTAVSVLEMPSGPAEARSIQPFDRSLTRQLAACRPGMWLEPLADFRGTGLAGHSVLLRVPGKLLRRTCLSRTLNSVDMVTAGAGLDRDGTPRLGLDRKGRVLSRERLGEQRCAP